jgi:uncharacterized protein YqjF (DUF2071 family)
MPTREILVTPTPFLTAQWRNLLMVNFAVDPAILTPLVPKGTELDEHAGHTFVSLVAFQFIDTRLRGWRIPFHHAFEELNLRFYVRRRVDGEVRRAVVFVREVVPRIAIAFVARAFYNERYVAYPMRHRIVDTPRTVTYEWRVARTWHTLSATGRGDAVVPPLDSHHAFITEHYWAYTRQRDGGTLEYQVTHPRWGVWDAQLTSLPDLAPLYGARWRGALTRPHSVLIADGSEVCVFKGVRLPAGGRDE